MITDVRVLNNQRTQEDTVRSLAGVQIGDMLETDTLDKVRERINTSGLFADTNVWWEQHGAGVRVNIAVKDKFPWAPVPTGDLVGQQQGDRAGVRARQPLRARQAVPAWGRGSRPSIRAPASPTAIRRCSAPGSTGSSRAWPSGR